jgi:aminopeptidase N
VRLTRLVAVAAVLLAAGCGTEPPPLSGPPSPSPGGTGPAGGYDAWNAGRSTPVRDPVYPDRGNPGLDVLHYGLDLTWAPKSRTLEGSATLRIRPTADADRIRLDFMPYTLDDVRVDDARVEASMSGQKLVVRAGVVKDRPLTLLVRYHGRPRTVPMPSQRSDAHPLGLTVTDDGGLWTMQRPYGALTWYPANDHPSDEALYDIAVTVPDGWSAIASGAPAGKDGNTFRYRSTDPVAPHLTTLAAGQYQRETAKGPHRMRLAYWYKPGDKDLLAVLRKSPSYLRFLESRFGPFPFPSGGAVIVDSDSAVETQEMITIGGRVREPVLSLVHEWAHHWFGNSVTPSTWQDLWLSEGWATYAQHLYRVERGDLSPRELETELRRADAESRAELGPPGQTDPENFGGRNVYVCAAAMLRELHAELGDRAFFGLARSWVQEHRNTSQDRASFTTFVNRTTGRDFTGLINSWLDDEETPT